MLPRKLDVAKQADRMWMARLDLVGLRLRIELDGVLQNFVLAFDQDEGVVERYKLRDGKPFQEGDHIACEAVRGSVKVTVEET